MDIQLNVDEAAVAEALKRAVTDSILGTEIQKAAVAAAQSMTKGWPSMLELAVQREAKIQLHAVMSEPENAERIRAVVRDYMTDEVLKKITSEVIAKLQRPSDW